MADRPDGNGFAVNRRRLLAGGAAALATGAAFTRCGTAQSGNTGVGFTSAAEPFYGEHQSGVRTTPQAHALFIALDLQPQSARSAIDTLAAVLKLWTADASRLTQGQPALADTEPELARTPSRLTITVGLGPSVFDRVGLVHRRPRSIAELPAFDTDRLEPKYCGGDLLLQICSDDAIAVFHASRVLLKNVAGMTRQRWRQNGFRGARSAGGSSSMRNMMGQVDGTANITDEPAFDRLVWDDGAAQPWFAGGTTLVVRRIRAEMDAWDELDRPTKELVVGRRLGNGAPLTGSHESDEPDLSATFGGIPVIPPNSHIALARHRSEGERFLRRPYNYDDPPTDDHTTDSGLIFTAYQRDPARQFVPVQQRLAAADAFNRWITTIGSATFAVLPGVRAGGYLGQTLFES